MNENLIAGQMLEQLDKGVSKADQQLYKNAPRLAGWFMPNTEAGSENHVYTPDIQGVPRRYQTDVGTTFNLNALHPKKATREEASQRLIDRYNHYETADPSMKGVYTDKIPGGVEYNDSDWSEEIDEEIQFKYELDSIGFTPTLGSILNEDSPLFKSFPNLRDITLDLNKAPTDGALGMFKPLSKVGLPNDEIEANIGGGEAHEGKVDWITTLKHEIQHAIDSEGGVVQEDVATEEYKSAIEGKPEFANFIKAAKSHDKEAIAREMEKLTPEQRALLDPKLLYYNSPIESIARMTTVTEGVENYDAEANLIKNQRTNNKLNSGLQGTARQELGL